MRVAFRVDASVAIGTGHVMRCLTLAEKLRQRGAEVSFICRPVAGNLLDFIAGNGFAVRSLPIDSPLDLDGAKDAEHTISLLRKRRADWLVVDHYFLDHAWESAVRPAVRQVMAIDDLVRRHDCNLLLDQNCRLAAEEPYHGLLPKFCATLIGPEYALLRDEFVRRGSSLRVRDGKVRNLLIFMGGSDAGNLTAMAISAIEALDRPDIDVSVVVGAVNPHREELQRRCMANPQLHYYWNINNMADLMEKADLAIGGGGSTTWERCLLGLPAMVLILAENQQAPTEAVAKAGAHVSLGPAEDVSAGKITQTLRLLCSDPQRLLEMGRSARSLIRGDHFRGADGVCEVMEGMYAVAQ